jgi:hypothetical protein
VFNLYLDFFIDFVEFFIILKESEDDFLRDGLVLLEIHLEVSHVIRVVDGYLDFNLLQVRFIKVFAEGLKRSLDVAEVLQVLLNQLSL